MRLNPHLLAAYLALACAPAFAAGSDSGGSSSGSAIKITDPEYARAVEAVKAEQFARAIPLLETFLKRVPNDADAENWLGFAYRKSGNLDAAFAHYDKALAILPSHRGAHEYAGEAWLMVGNLAKAEEHLKSLDRLCWLPCEEYDDLKQAVAAYKTRQGATAAAK